MWCFIKKNYILIFFNLLLWQLPGKDGETTVCQPRILPKLIIVSPQSCQCPNSFTDVDENIVHVGHIPFKASRAGNIDRDYKNSVYKVTDPETLEVRRRDRNSQMCQNCLKKNREFYWLMEINLLGFNLVNCSISMYIWISNV